MLEMWLCEVRLVKLGELASEAMSTLEIREWGPELRASTVRQMLTQVALTHGAAAQVWSRVLLSVCYFCFYCLLLCNSNM